MYVCVLVCLQELNFLFPLYFCDGSKNNHPVSYPSIIRDCYRSSHEPFWRGTSTITLDKEVCYLFREPIFNVPKIGINPEEICKTRICLNIL